VSFGSDEGSVEKYFCRVKRYSEVQITGHCPRKGEYYRGYLKRGKIYLRFGSITSSQRFADKEAQ
jgi:hypothetical protein